MEFLLLLAIITTFISLALSLTSTTGMLNSNLVLPAINFPNLKWKCTRQHMNFSCNYGVWHRSKYMRRCVAKTVIYCNHMLSYLDGIRCLWGNLHLNFYPNCEKKNFIRTYSLHEPVIKCSWVLNLLFLCVWLCVYSRLRGSLVLRSGCVCARWVCVFRRLGRWELWDGTSCL